MSLFQGRVHFHRTTIERKCDWCHQAVIVGDYYSRWLYVDEDYEAHTIWQHIECYGTSSEAMDFGDPFPAEPRETKALSELSPWTLDTIYEKLGERKLPGLRQRLEAELAVRILTQANSVT